MHPKFKHLFFDLDRTLWDFEHNSKLTLKEIFHTTSLQDHIDHFEHFHHTYLRINSDLWQKYGRKKITKEELRDSRFLKVLEHHNIHDHTLAARISADYLNLSPQKTQLFPGAIDTLSELKKRGHQLHIITNGFVEVQYIKLKSSGLEPFFDVVVCSEHVGFNKPDRRIFNHAMSEAGANPENSVMIGDDLDVDVLGANQAGMEAILFDPDKKHKSRAFRVIRELPELLLPVY